jgi:hypothetical protein
MQSSGAQITHMISTSCGNPAVFRRFCLWNRLAETGDRERF